MMIMIMIMIIMIGIMIIMIMMMMIIISLKFPSGRHAPPPDCRVVGDIVTLPPNNKQEHAKKH